MVTTRKVLFLEGLLKNEFQILLIIFIRKSENWRSYYG